MTIETFEHIAKTLRPQLMNLCNRFLISNRLPEEAEDMVQETLFRLWQMRERLDNYQSPEALAVTIAKNVCIDHLRKQHLRLEPLEENDAEAPQETDQSLIDSETLTWIQKTLAHLPANQRRMLMMRSEGMTIDEISTICNTTQQSTRTMISSARKLMLKLLRKGRQ
jgi:RNA polymerase sigma-70 factor (ECF subfamily)